MAITLEWAYLPSETYLRTICRDGVPLPEVTHYLFIASASPVGSVRTPRAYAQQLLPFHIWLDHHRIRLQDVTFDDVMKFKHDLHTSDCKVLGLLRKGAESADYTLVQIVNSTVRFLKWVFGPLQTTPLSRWRQRFEATQESFHVRSASRLQLVDRVDHARARRPRRRVPKHLTYEQLDQCRRWIMQPSERGPILPASNS